jgi:hypothetical protein
VRGVTAAGAALAPRLEPQRVCQRSRLAAGCQQHAHGQPRTRLAGARAPAACLCGSRFFFGDHHTLLRCGSAPSLHQLRGSVRRLLHGAAASNAPVRLTLRVRRCPQLLWKFGLPAARSLPAAPTGAGPPRPPGQSHDHAARPCLAAVAYFLGSRSLPRRANCRGVQGVWAVQGQALLRTFEIDTPRQRVGRGLPAATTAHTPLHARGSVEDEVAADAAASLSANLVIL